jgi:hypothetical protein
MGKRCRLDRLRDNERDLENGAPTESACATVPA